MNVHFVLLPSKMYSFRASSDKPVRLEIVLFVDTSIYRSRCRHRFLTMLLVVVIVAVVFFSLIVILPVILRLAVIYPQ